MKLLSFMSYLYTICNHMTKFRILSKFSINCGSDDFRFGFADPLKKQCKIFIVHISDQITVLYWISFILLEEITT